MTACADRMNAANADVVDATTGPAAGATARPPYAKQAATRARSASDFARLVSCCVVSPSFVPRSNSTVKATTSAIATGVASELLPTVSAESDSPNTSATAAVDADVDIQSFQPTRKPA